MSYQNTSSECLQYLLQRCNMSSEDVQSEIENMKKQEYLQQHSCEIWQGKDGRWRTYLPDATEKKGRRLTAKASREKLEQEIIKHYKSPDTQEQAKRVNLKTWYPQWLEYKKLLTRSDMYIRRIASDWDNYYKEDSIIGIPLVNPDYDTFNAWKSAK